MGKNAHTAHVRLSPELLHKFRAFHAKHFGGLPASLIMRMLIIDQLEKPEDSLVAIVLENIKGGKSQHVKHGSNRIGSNANKQ